MFVTACHLHSSLTFAVRQESFLRVGGSLGWAPALPEHIRLGWKCLKMANTLSYYDTELKMVVKVFFFSFGLVGKSLVNKMKSEPSFRL